MKNGTSRVLCAGVVALIIGVGAMSASAQPTAHYVPGVEGTKAASLPPPGFYIRDYNVFYDANQINNSTGHEIHGTGFKTFVYAQVFRPLWITDAKFLGGSVGIDGFWPIISTDVRANTPFGKFDTSNCSFGDPFLEATLSWHLPQWDLALGLGEWFPAGAYATAPTAKPGLGYFGTMFTAGATWYPDTEKTWSLSILGRYEINCSQRDTHIVPGDALTLEWGVAKSVIKPVDVGVVGYYQQQTTVDRGTGASRARDGVFAVGPEVGLALPPHLFLTARYCREVWASNRAEGNTYALTLTYRF